MNSIRDVMDASFLISKKLAMNLSQELIELYKTDDMKDRDDSIYKFIPLNTIAYFLASNCIALAQSYQQAGNVQSSPHSVYLAIMELTEKYIISAMKEEAKIQ